MKDMITSADRASFSVVKSATDSGRRNLEQAVGGASKANKDDKYEKKEG